VPELRGISGKVISRNIRPGLSINRRLGLNQLMSVSAYYENLTLRLQSDSEVSLKNLSYNYLTASYDYNINTVDSQHFPDRGTILNISASISKLFSGIIQNDSSRTVSVEYDTDIFSFDRFFTLYGNIKHYFSPSDKLTFEIGGDALFITDSDTVSAQNNPYLLGGIISLNKRAVPLVGFFSNEVPVEKMAGIRAEADYKLFRKFHVNVMANVFLAEDINHGDSYFLLTGYGLGFGYMSIVGPLRIGLMNGNSTPKKYLNTLLGYFSLGYNF